MEAVVTGIGPVLPNCVDRATLWAQLRDGDSQLTFEPAPGGAPGEEWAVGRIRDFQPRRWLERFPARFYERYDRQQQLYLSSLVIALEDARLNLARVPRERCGLFDGSSRGSFDYWYDRIRDERQQAPSALYTQRELIVGTPGQAANLGASLFGIHGPVHTFASTCCAGAVAIGHALREVALGEIDVALATGHDSSLAAPFYYMYRDAGLLSDEREDPRRALKPFVGHSRNVFGEGAVTLVLESRAHAEARGAHPLAVLRGFKYGNNGGHPISVDAEGTRAAALVEALLAQTGVAKARIGFVVGHGNGVPQSDRSEQLYMQRIFDDRAREVPLLSVKPIYGHLLGGSSALNIAAAALMLHHRWLLPTINVDATAAADLPVEHLAGGGRPTREPAGLSISYGIGGHNAVTLLERAS
jgi:3-oxoacyl-[acyl-carrier-protein] synthase II